MLSFIDRAGSLTTLLAAGTEIAPHKKEVWLDVTHTVDFPFTSGVQRVVREIASNLYTQNNVRLVRFIHEIGVYRYVTPSEAANLLSKSESVSVGFSLGRRSWSVRNLFEVFKCKARQVLPELLKDFVIIPAYALILRSIRRKALSGFSIPVPEGNTVIIPEVVGVASRMDWLRSYASSGLLEFVPILYDLIPLKRPDLAAFGEDFAKYLGLFHFSKRVSCISEAARQDLLRYLEFVERTGVSSKVESHHLGCNLKKEGLSAELENQTSDSKKILLCVGTIENRKNQISIVKSLYSLKHLNSEFKVVFIGNTGPGYLCFKEETERARANGFDIEVLVGASETKLNEMYRAAFATLFCSLEEGFGLPILESRYHGKVCIVSDKGSMNEVASKLGSAIFVDPTNIDSIAEGIQDALTWHERFKIAHKKLAEPMNWPTWAEYSQQLLSFAKQ